MDGQGPEWDLGDLDSSSDPVTGPLNKQANFSLQNFSLQKHDNATCLVKHFKMYD